MKVRFAKYAPMKHAVLKPALLTLGLVACTAEPAPAPAAPASAAAPLSAAAPATAAPATAAPATAAMAVGAKPFKTVGHAKGGQEINWENGAQWSDWTTGLARAKQEKKPILLMVYADWCPRCRELAPVFNLPEVTALEEGLVLIRQNGDEKPEWLQAFDSLGGYVPRVFFLTPDGSLREDITSGHPRYPYFYTPAGVEALKDAMRAAVKS